MSSAALFSKSNSPKLSVLIPVFNQEDWLAESLSSLALQKVFSAEFLIINDGSTDSSRSIAVAFAAKDKRFRLVDRVNGGYGAAMNTGLDEARGDWIGIMEPDDVCLSDTYAALLLAAEEGHATSPDVVKGLFQEINEEGTVVGFGNAMYRPASQCFHASSEPDLYVIHHSLWSAIYRREFLKAKGLRFPVFSGGYQDAVFATSLWLSDPLVRWLARPVYGYRRCRPGNSVGDGNRIDAALASLDEMVRIITASASPHTAAAWRGFGASAVWHALRLDAQNLPDFCRGAYALFMKASSSQAWPIARSKLMKDPMRAPIVRALESGRIRQLHRGCLIVRSLSAVLRPVRWLRRL